MNNRDASRRDPCGSPAQRTGGLRLATTGIRRVCVVVIVMACFAVTAHAGQTSPALRGACAGVSWQGAWAAAPSDADSSYSDQSLRLIVTPLRGGSTLRVRLSNRLSDEPVTFGSVYVGKQRSGAKLVPGSNRPLRFDGQTSVTIPAGGEVESDAVALSFRAFEHLAVTVHVSGTIAAATRHLAARQTSFISDPGAGDLTADDDGSGFTRTTTTRPFLTGIDVLAPRRNGVVAAIGDSITDGDQRDRMVHEISIDQDARYPDFLARRLKSSRFGARLSVVNLGIGGNQVLVDFRTFAGPSLLSRIEPDVLEREDVTDVILLEGINDLGSLQAPPASPEALIEGLERAVRLLKSSRRDGRPLNVLVGTLTPAGTAVFPSYVAAEPQRQIVNEHIRTSGIGDGYVDFDHAVRDPSDPSRLAPEYDGGDGLHLSPAGYERMAQEVDLAQLRGRDCQAARLPHSAIGEREVDATASSSGEADSSEVVHRATRQER